MATSFHVSFLMLFFCLTVTLPGVSSAAVHVCPNMSCGANDLEFPIHFPFQLTTPTPNAPRLTPVYCGYPRFGLSCNRSQTILNLPASGSFAIQNIDYATQSLWLNDPNHCLPRRLLNFSLVGSPFRPQITQNFTLLNCSSDEAALMPVWRVIGCMSEGNYRVMSVPSSMYNGSAQSCRVVRTVLVPVALPDMLDLDEDVLLTWDSPDCRWCITRGGICGPTNVQRLGLEVGCTNVPRTGLPRTAKYGIIIGIGIPGTLLIVGLATYVCSLISDYSRRRNGTASGSSLRITIVPPSFVTTGLNRPTIESFPKTMLGASRRLPKPDNNTCPICLCEYEAKDTLRTIPECDHYFHADCIDEWLKMNGTCPLCRNSPEGSSD